jgi:hypothetical protein
LYSEPGILPPRRRARVEHEALGPGGATTRPQEAPLDYADEIAERAVEFGGVVEGRRMQNARLAASNWSLVMQPRQRSGIGGRGQS